MTYLQGGRNEESEKQIMVPETGSICGLKIRGNAEIDLRWEENELMECVIRAKSDLRNKILYKGNYREFTIAAGETFTYEI